MQTCKFLYPAGDPIHAHKFKRWSADCGTFVMSLVADRPFNRGPEAIQKVEGVAYGWMAC